MRDSTRYENVEEKNGFKYVRLKSGRLYSFWDAHRDADLAEGDLHRALSRMFKLVSDDPDDYDLERIEWFLDNMETYVKYLQKQLEERYGRKTAEERIALLRNTTGRTPEEAEAFLKKADELEGKLNGT